MNKLVKAGALSAGGVGLFVGAFIVFAALSGVPLSRMSVIGPMIAPPPEEPRPQVQPKNPIADAPTRKPDHQVVRSNVDVLDAFVISSPFNQEDLEILAEELKGKLVELEARSSALKDKERLLVEREEALEARYDELMSLRSALDGVEAELEARTDELQRDEAAVRERIASSWKRIARSFESGDPAELTNKLLLYEPEDAAWILSGLDAERASELLNVVPTERYREYADAYRKHSSDARR